jgi:hypothetical protein
MMIAISASQTQAENNKPWPVLAAFHPSHSIAGLYG